MKYSRYTPMMKLFEGGNKIDFQGDDRPALYEVKIFNKKGKLKETISQKILRERHWEIAKAEAKNKRYRGATKKGDIYYVGS